MAAKKHKTLGKVNRGRMNSAMTPTNTGNDEVTTLFEEVISSATDKIIRALSESKGTEDDILENVVIMSKQNIQTTLEEFKKSFDNKMTALLAAVYGNTSPNKDADAATWASKLGAIDPEKTPLKGIYVAIRDMANDLAEPLNTIGSNNDSSKLYTLIESHFNTITELFKKYNETGNVVRNEVVLEGADAETLAKLAELAKLEQTDNGIFTNFVKSLNAAVGELDNIKDEDYYAEKLEILDKVTRGIIETGKSIDDKTLANLKDSIENYVKVLDAEHLPYLINQLNSIPQVNKDKILENLGIVNDVLNKIIKAELYLSIISIMANNAIKGTTQIETIMSALDGAFTNTPVITKKTVNNIERIEKALKAYALIGTSLVTISVIGPLAVIGTKMMNLEISSIATIVKKFDAIEISDDMVNKMKSLSILVMSCGALMIMAATAGGFVTMHLVDLVTFTGALALFTISILKAVNFGTKDFNNAEVNVGQLMAITTMSAAVLLTGAFIIAEFPELIASSLIFTTALSLFIFGITYSYSKLDNKKNLAESAIGFSLLVGIAASTLLIGGGLLELFPDLAGKMALFGLILTGFVFVVVGAYNLASRGVKNALKDAGSLAMLIGISTLVLLAGATFIKNGEQALNALMFGAVLSGFILMVTLAYGAGSWIARDGLENADALMKLIVLSAATLAIGGALMLIDGMPEAIKNFGIILGGFIFAISISIGIFAKLAKNAIGSVVALSIIIALTSAALLTAGLLMINNDGLQDAIESFAFTTTIMVGAMAAIVWLLGMIPKAKLTFGLISLVVIGLVINSMVDTFKKLTDVANTMDNDKIWDALKAMGAVVASAMGIIAVVSGIIAIPGVGLIGAAVIAGAEALLAGVIKIIDMTAGAMLKISAASNSWATMKIPNAKHIADGISTFIAISASLSPLANPVLALTAQAASSTVSSISKMMSEIASGIKDIASLNIPAYDDNGKIIGRRPLTPNDFNEAANNIFRIVTIIGDAIITLYKERPEMFEDVSRWYERGSKTPFALVIRSVTGMGKMISDIANGVKNYANMRINEYDKNGKVIGTRPMTEQDFTNASTNIGRILIALADSIDKTYTEHKELFKDPILWGDSPFGMVKKSMSGVSQLIIGAVNAIKAVNELDFKKLGIDNDENGVKSKIYKILTAVSSAIDDVTESDAFKNINEDNVTILNSIVASYSKGIKDISSALNGVPADYTKYDNLTKGLAAINTEIAKIPNLERFNQQTRDMTAYVKTINSLQTNKVDKLISLTESITMMSDKLGSLDEFTDVMANKVTAVLSALADRIDESSRTIKTADKIQSDRHKKINEALDNLKKLLSKPLDINVTHKAQDMIGPDSTPGSDTGGTNDNGTTGGYASSSGFDIDRFSAVTGLSNETTETITNNSNNISERRMREIAKNEVTKGLNDYAAKHDPRRGK